MALSTAPARQASCTPARQAFCTPACLAFLHPLHRASSLHPFHEHPQFHHPAPLAPHPHNPISLHPLHRTSTPLPPCTPYTSTHCPINPHLLHHTSILPPPCTPSTAPAPSHLPAPLAPHQHPPTALHPLRRTCTPLPCTPIIGAMTDLVALLCVQIELQGASCLPDHRAAPVQRASTLGCLATHLPTALKACLPVGCTAVVMLSNLQMYSVLFFLALLRALPMSPPPCLPRPPTRLLASLSARVPARVLASHFASQLAHLPASLLAWYLLLRLPPVRSLGIVTTTQGY